ncbi:MAG: lysostaphin resistance A-like protein [Pyrinomonadaceae bacterium]
MTFRDAFYDRHERLRSGWRAVLFLLLLVLLAVFLGVAAAVAASRLSVAVAAGGPATLALNGIVTLIASLAAGWLCARSLEGLPFRSLGASPRYNWLRNLSAGLALGGVSIVIAAALAAAFGDLDFEFNTDGAHLVSETLFASLVVFTLAAAAEEALFRGYLLQTLSRSGLAWLAIALTSTFFALAHSRNPNANAFAVANTALAGIWLGVAYLKTRDLWFPFGIHLAWNWLQGAVFGIEVSGLTDVTAHPLLREIDRGPAWITGENYGIEASVACTIALLLSIIAISLMPGIRPSPELKALTSPPQSEPAA